jgi:hypothetical protein
MRRPASAIAAAAAPASSTKLPAGRRKTMFRRARRFNHTGIHDAAGKRAQKRVGGRHRIGSRCGERHGIGTNLNNRGNSGARPAARPSNAAWRP